MVRNYLIIKFNFEDFFLFEKKILVRSLDEVKDQDLLTISELKIKLNSLSTFIKTSKFKHKN